MAAFLLVSVQNQKGPPTKRHICGTKGSPFPLGATAWSTNSESQLGFLMWVCPKIGIHKKWLVSFWFPFKPLQMGYPQKETSHSKYVPTPHPTRTLLLSFREGQRAVAVPREQCEESDSPGLRTSQIRLLALFPVSLWYQLQAKPQAAPEALSRHELFNGGSASVKYIDQPGGFLFD